MRPKGKTTMDPDEKKEPTNSPAGDTKGAGSVTADADPTDSTQGGGFEAKTPASGTDEGTQAVDVVNRLTQHARKALEEMRKGVVTRAEFEEKYGRITRDLATSVENMKRWQQPAAFGRDDASDPFIRRRVPVLATKNALMRYRSEEYDPHTDGVKVLDERIYDLKYWRTMAYLCHHLLRRQAAESDIPYPGMRSLESFQTYDRLVTTYFKDCGRKDLLERYQAEMKQIETGQIQLDIAQKGTDMATTTAQAGLEWAPASIVANLFEYGRPALIVGQVFPEQRMRRSPETMFYLPGSVIAYVVGENINFQSATSSNSKLYAAIPTGNFTITARMLKLGTILSTQFDEDSLIEMGPRMLQDFGYAMGDAREGWTINGDATATHQDSSDSWLQDLTTDPFKTVSAEHQTSGLRKDAIVNSNTIAYTSGGTKKLWEDGDAPYTASTGGIPSGAIKFIGDLLSKIEKGWNIPADCVLVTSVLGSIQLLMLPEVLTLERYGNAFTAWTGEVGRILGIRILASGRARDDLNTSGVFTTATTGQNKTAIYLANYRRNYLWAMLRATALESFRDIDYSQLRTVATARAVLHKYAKTAAGADRKTVAMGKAIAA